MPPTHPKSHNTFFFLTDLTMLSRRCRILTFAITNPRLTYTTSNFLKGLVNRKKKKKLYFIPHLRYKNVHSDGNRCLSEMFRGIPKICPTFLKECTEIIYVIHMIMVDREKNNQYTGSNITTETKQKYFKLN